jgi:hypothetical protein
MVNLEYCDYIATVISKTLIEDSTKMSTHIEDSTNPRLDLNNEGQYLSSKRTIQVMDRNGTTYKVTIEVNND